MFCHLPQILTWALLLARTNAAPAVTVYGIYGVQPQDEIGQGPLATKNVNTDFLNTLQAYNNVSLQVPSLLVQTASQFSLALANSADKIVVGNLSQAAKGDFLGFSIEMSVVESVIGRNSSFIQVPLLNLLATVSNRAGGVRIRVGGNTQEYATLVDSLPNQEMTMKGPLVAPAGSNTMAASELLYTPEMLRLLQQVSSLTKAKWYLGIPFNDTSNPRLQIAEQADAILGSNVLGYQIGNEPDLYAGHGRRASTYGPQDYFTEFGTMITAIQNDKKITSKGNIVGPSIQGDSKWTLEDVIGTGYLNAYGSDLSVISVEHYATSNCAASFPAAGFKAVAPEDALQQLLSHSSTQALLTPYLNTIGIAQQMGKEFMLFETNTASCGGFPGVSDAFASALFMVDFSLQMVTQNIAGAHLHMGGQNASYNPFTPPPTNVSMIKQWTVGPSMYSTLFVAEALGTTGTAQVLDLVANSGSDLTPAYAIYENGQLARVALMNFMDASGGGAPITVTISAGGDATGEANSVPAQVRVKYLLAPSVVEKDEVTWANQTFGGRFQADGRLTGTEVVQTVSCDQTANTCTIQVPAPGAALVFLSSAAQASADAASATQTFATTAVTRSFATAPVDATSLAHSNGERPNHLLGTSKGGAETDEGRQAASLWESAMFLLLRAANV